jgi:hypothetical protein
LHWELTDRVRNIQEENMNVTATGTSSLTALYLQQLLGSSGTSLLGSTTGEGTGTTDSLSISAAGQAASGTQGTDPFKTDLAALEATLKSGDLDASRKAYQAMVDKMKEHGAVPSDFAAIGKALDSGDLDGAKTALDAVEKNVASHQGPPSSDSNPMKNDMDQLGSLLQAGDLTGAQSLFASIQTKLKAHGAQGSTTDTAATDLSSALASGDTTSATSAWEKLMAQLQAQQSSYAKRMESMAASAYSANAGAI